MKWTLIGGFPWTIDLDSKATPSWLHPISMGCFIYHWAALFIWQTQWISFMGVFCLIAFPAATRWIVGHYSGSNEANLAIMSGLYYFGNISLSIFSFFFSSIREVFREFSLVRKCRHFLPKIRLLLYVHWRFLKLLSIPRSFTAANLNSPMDSSEERLSTTRFAVTSLRMTLSRRRDSCCPVMISFEERRWLSIYTLALFHGKGSFVVGANIWFHHYDGQGCPSFCRLIPFQMP